MGKFFKEVSGNKAHIFDTIWNNFCQILDRHTYTLRVITHLKPPCLWAFFNVALSALLFPTFKNEWNNINWLLVVHVKNRKDC